MIEITASLVNELRSATGAPLMKCKAALRESNGDLDQAGRLLRQKGTEGITPRASVGNQGYIAVYSHPGSQIVSLVELACDTDFVARSEAFRSIAGELAMQVVATAPVALSPSDLPETMRAEELRMAKAQTETDTRTAMKPIELREQIARSKADKVFSEKCLLTQPWVRDPKVSVGSLMEDLRLRVREGIYVRRFARWSVGETLTKV
jgi:elongation factor Ts